MANRGELPAWGNNQKYARTALMQSFEKIKTESYFTGAACAALIISTPEKTRSFAVCRININMTPVNTSFRRTSRVMFDNVLYGQKGLGIYHK